MKALLAVLVATAAFASTHAATVDEASLRLPAAGDTSLHVLTPSYLELTAITAPDSGAKPLNLAVNFRTEDFEVTSDGQPVGVDLVGFKRRVLYAPVKYRDLRITTQIYLAFRQPLSAETIHRIEVKNRRSPLWEPDHVFTATTDSLRYSPVIHVNQEGYAPGFPKVGMVGYFIGTAGELRFSTDAGFDIVEARSGKSVFHGTLVSRRDAGFTVTPKPYQRVYEANFSAFQIPGEYRLVVPGLGASLPFRIDEGEIMNFTRAYALGLLQQRCGTALEMPYTRFIHDACHTAPAEIPMPADRFSKAWDIIGKLANDKVKPEHPEEQLRDAKHQLYPFVRKGSVDVSGGHHDAGDYSKYTTNSAQLIHILMFAVDSLPGVAQLDNLGIPESGDGIGDVLQEAKWESDFLAKMQDDDGGFYFLVYPRDRRYEGGTPDHGDSQIVWPKTTAATAAAVAALAQCASSPEFKRHYPEEAKRYLQQAERGWKFLEEAIARHGMIGSYQRLTHYGDDFQHDDELAWAACELYLATGAAEYEKKLFEWYPSPTDPKTRRWMWRSASFCYGNVLRSYAFGARSGRLPGSQLDPRYLERCEMELRRAGDDALRAWNQNAYATSYPEQSKRIVAAGWYFPSDEAFDLTVAYQLEPRPQYVEAVIGNLNFEAGCNPVNISFIAGLGQRRPREMVHQYAQGDARVLPPSGLPFGSLQSQFDYLERYGPELREESWPKDAGTSFTYPLYDRWSDAFNVTTEFVVTNLARSLTSLAFWAAKTPLKTQPWKPLLAKITTTRNATALNESVTFKLESPDIDLSTARIVWEGRDQEPAYGTTYTATPRNAGVQWVEAEAALPDGRRAVARTEFRADAPIVYWVNGQLPRGASPTVQGGDRWSWVKPASKPPELIAKRSSAAQHESALADGIHEHGFDHAEANLGIDRGDVLFAYVFIDPEHPPKTIMLEWHDDSFEHRAYWGANEITYGKNETEGRRSMGPLPPAGRWVRLEVPAAAVGLEGREIKGMVFRAYNGRVRWDASGKMTSAYLAHERGQNTSAYIAATPSAGK